MFGVAFSFLTGMKASMSKQFVKRSCFVASDYVIEGKQNKVEGLQLYLKQCTFAMTGMEK